MRSALEKPARMLSTQNTMRHSYFKAWPLVCVLAIPLVSHAQRTSSAYGYDLNERPITSLAAPGAEAIVLFFVASDCPISNRYIPELQRLENKFAAQHVVFWFVYPNVGETPEAVRQHEAAYGAEKNILLDPHHQLVALTRTTVTPESAVLVPQRTGEETLRTVYHGRIDDRYLHIGQERPSATQHDLERAIADVLQHRTVQQPGGPAVGCGIIGQP
jgi:thiol-disulfide isomerase/thioredoxin